MSRVRSATRVSPSAGQDMKPRPALGVGQGFRSFMLQALKISVHRGCDREDRLCRWRLGKRCNIASLPLRLKEVQNAGTVGRRMVIGDCNGRDFVLSGAEIPTAEPIAHRSIPCDNQGATRYRSRANRACRNA